MSPLLFLPVACVEPPIELGTIYEDCTSVFDAPAAEYGGDPLVPDPDEGTYGAAPEPYVEHQGVPARDPSRSRSFLWRTDTTTRASEVQLGPADTWPSGARTFEGASFTFGSDSVSREHEARVCGELAPNTTYTWRVGGGEAWSDEHHFTTPGPPGSDGPIRVLVMGDSRSDMATWGTVATMAEGLAPDLILFTGDAVSVGETQQDWEAWFAAAGDLLADVPFLPVLGNHEDLAQNWFAQFGLPNNEEWYTVDWLGLRVVGTNDQADDDTIGDDEVAWQRDALAEPRDWRIVENHEAPWSIGTIHGSNLTIRDTWAPVWDAGDVDLVVSGHNHAYERTVPITAAAEAAGGVTYVVSGGAGAPLYENSLPDWFNLVYVPEHHVVLVELDGEVGTVTAYDTSGLVIDSFTLQK